MNDDISQNYLTSQPVFKYFQIFSGTIDKRLGWKLKWLSEESITTPDTSNNNFTPILAHTHNSKTAVKLEGNYLKQEKVLFTRGNIEKVLFMN